MDWNGSIIVVSHISFLLLGNGYARMSGGVTYGYTHSSFLLLGDGYPRMSHVGWDLWSSSYLIFVAGGWLSSYVGRTYGYTHISFLLLGDGYPHMLGRLMVIHIRRLTF